MRLEFGPGRGRERRGLFGALERGRLTTARQVERLHELLCFARAYPDDAPTRAQVVRMLDRFAARADLERHRAALADTGIAGTTIDYRFFEPTARWLAQRWPGRLTIDWNEFEHSAALENLLGLLAHPAEVPGLDTYAFSTRAWPDHACAGRTRPTPRF